MVTGVRFDHDERAARAFVGAVRAELDSSDWFEGRLWEIAEAWGIRATADAGRRVFCSPAGRALAKYRGGGLS